MKFMDIWREKIFGDKEVELIETDLQAIDEIDGFRVRPGFFRMNGACESTNGISFTVSSHNATKCTLLLFHEGEKEPFARLPYPDSYRIGDTYSMMVYDIKASDIEYAFVFDGPYDP